MSALVSQVSRRTFLGTSMAVGGSLLVAFPLDTQSQEDAAPLPTPQAFIRIDPSGQVTLILPYVEMGQGAYTAQAQILAEELEVDPAGVRIEAAPPQEPLYASPLFGGQITGGSGSLRGAWMTMRTAGAAARLMLVQSAASRWRVPAAACSAAAGRVVHVATQRSFGYGELAADAARLPVPRTPRLKQPSQFKVMGRPQKRLDTPAKINGTAVFSIDVRPPGLRHAMVTASPVFAGRLAAVDAQGALAIQGVRQVVRTDNAVAVVADHTWAARKGLAALRLEWDEGAAAGLSTADLLAAADAALDRSGLIAAETGDVRGAEAAATSRYEAVFRLPMLAHASMEPLSCTVHWTPQRCEVWLGSQILARAQRTAAEAAGLPPGQVIVHNHLLGGGFGRRLEVDYVAQAVTIARQVDGPVKVTWSREEDMQHDFYRFHNHSRVSVGMDGAGQPVSWRHRIVGPNIMARFLPAYQKDGIDLDVVDGAKGPYDIPHVLVDFVRNEAPAGLSTGNWRGVGATRNVFIVESVIDELAHRAGSDVVAYRRALIRSSPRTRAVLDMLAARPAWTTPLERPTAQQGRRGRGIAVFEAFGSHLAMCARVLVAPTGAVRVEHVDCVIDTGFVVNPDVVRAQIEGGINFGLSAVLYGRITVAGGRIQQGNFDTYPVLRMHEAPAIEVHIISSGEEPGGVGEPGTSGIFAAVANAVFDATGQRLLSLPIDAAQLRPVQA
ncbi:MAG: molybdopterin cofactor-binding domain-containing protein [Steroidobacteraceae bacterium]